MTLNLTRKVVNEVINSPIKLTEFTIERALANDWLAMDTEIKRLNKSLREAIKEIEEGIVYFDENGKATKVIHRDIIDIIQKHLMIYRGGVKIK